MTTRGFCPYPGLVAGEACRVRMLALPPGTDYVGRAMPQELFERDLDASVFHVGGKRADGGIETTVRLSDQWLEDNINPFLRRLVGGEPPSPFPYRVMPRHYLNGWTRVEELRTGDRCWIWIKPEGNIPWLERAPDTLPNAFPGYPHEHLVGFWQARVTAILKPRDPAVTVRKLRAVLVDERIRAHTHPRVRELYGHEPWADYSVTLTDNELGEAGEEMLDGLVDGAKRLASRLPKVEIPEWLRGGTGGGSLWQSDDFLET